MVSYKHRLVRHVFNKLLGEAPMSLLYGPRWDCSLGLDWPQLFFFFLKVTSPMTAEILWTFVAVSRMSLKKYRNMSTHHQETTKSLKHIITIYNTSKYVCKICTVNAYMDHHRSAFLNSHGVKTVTSATWSPLPWSWTGCLDAKGGQGHLHGPRRPAPAPGITAAVPRWSRRHPWRTPGDVGSRDQGVELDSEVSWWKEIENCFRLMLHGRKMKEGCFFCFAKRWLKPTAAAAVLDGGGMSVCWLFVTPIPLVDDFHRLDWKTHC